MRLQVDPAAEKELERRMAARGKMEKYSQFGSSRSNSALGAQT
ncbi:hypothetical protein [Accumulibacter sp.]|nr:hypothetical protein [Accumulibacter sp.]